MPRLRTTPSQRIGDAAESLAAERLVAEGWTILGRNVRLGRDELDLVAVDPGPPPMLVVVEVRRRGRRDFGLPEETLDHRKRMALRRGLAALAGRMASGALPDGTGLPRLALRLDLIAIDERPDGATSVRHHRAIRP